MTYKIKDEQKRMIIVLDRILHTSIKIRAAQKGVTLKEWVTLAVIKQLKEEEEMYGGKDGNVLTM